MQIHSETPPPPWLSEWLAAMERKRHKVSNGTIPTVRRYGVDWALLYVPRGVGQQFMQQILPGTPLVWVATPHYRAYQQNLVLVVNHLQVLAKIQSVRLTMHCLVQGKYTCCCSSSSLSSRDNDDDEIGSDEYTTCVRVLQHAPSNTMGGISWVSVWNKSNSPNSANHDEDKVDHDVDNNNNNNKPAKRHLQKRLLAAHQIRPRQFRKDLQAAGHAVLGNAEEATSFRGHGLLMSGVALRIEWKDDDDDACKMMIIEDSLEPPRFWQAILDKERRFWQDRHGHDESPDTTETASSNIHMPIAYRTNQVTFGPQIFIVSPAVMIPRSGSYTLVDVALSLWKQQQQQQQQQQEQQTETLYPTRVWDLGTGSGCLLLSLLHALPSSSSSSSNNNNNNDTYTAGVATQGWGVDISSDALHVAAQNSHGLADRVTWLCATFDNPLRENVVVSPLNGGSSSDCIGIVVCNPPYHDGRPGRQGTLDASTIQYEPALALFVAQNDGENVDLLLHYLQALQGILQIRKVTQPSCLIVVFEVCRNNAEAVYVLMQKAGIRGLSMARDDRKCIRSVQGVLRSADIMTPNPS